MSDLKSVTKVQWPVVGSVVVGLAAFGLLVYGIRKLPATPVTNPLKQAADAVNQ